MIILWHHLNFMVNNWLFKKTKLIIFFNLGIGQTPIGDAKSAQQELLKYLLYPKTINQTGFNDTKIEDTIFKKTFSYSLYFSKQYADSGIRVMQSQCWKDLINLFSNTMIKGETISIVKQNKVDSVVGGVKILGSISL